MLFGSFCGKLFHETGINEEVGLDVAVKFFLGDAALVEHKVGNAAHPCGQLGRVFKGVDLFAHAIERGGT